VHPATPDVVVAGSNDYCAEMTNGNGPDVVGATAHAAAPPPALRAFCSHQRDASGNEPPGEPETLRE
jgi:hypothetical protein